MPADASGSRPSLEACIRMEASRRRLRLPAAGAAVLAGLDYGLECKLKERALGRFWNEHGLPGRPEAIVCSPRPRHYRTTSKRRCRHAVGTGRRAQAAASGVFLPPGEGAERLEPEEHGRIFAALSARLASPDFAPLARVLNFVIIRGSYDEFMVIFNVRALDRGLHRLLVRSAESLRGPGPNVVSTFLMVDPGGSPYYLEADRPRSSFRLKRLFGPERYRLRLEDALFLIPPDSFSQVNESMLPPLLAHARALLAGEGGGRLLDLYCGYGLFAFGLGRRYREVIAIDSALPAIRSARDMLARMPDPPRIRFRAASISRNTLAAELPPPHAGGEDAVLDPPRRGADREVLASIARRRPLRVLHVFCASEEIPAALGHWRRHGYFVRRVVPLDMFAGTPQLETLVLLSPA